MDIGIFIILSLLVLLITLLMLEPISIDLIALSIPVILVILGRWTQVTPEEAISGFSSSATITILAMFIISTGVERSGIVQKLGDKIVKVTQKNEYKQLILIILISGIIAGLINNTPVVALFIPMVIGIANRSKVSPSKFLIPLSYAAMMGGMLTLIGTSSNIVANDILVRQLGRGFSMFEFTHLGLIVLLTGTIYLITMGYKLLPPRLSPQTELAQEFNLDEYLTEMIIKEDSPLKGMTVEEALEQFDFEIDVIEIIRGKERFFQPLQNKILQEEDHLIIRTNQKNLLKLIQGHRMKINPKRDITQDELEKKEEEQKLVELVIPHGSFLEEQTLNDVNFLERYNTSVLAIRKGKELEHSDIGNIVLRAGDVLLLTAGPKTLKRLRKNRNFIISNDIYTSDYRPSKMIISIGILGTVILLATLNILPIYIAALGGVIAMVVSGCLKSKEVYQAVNWDVIFLLSGLLPLGIAMDKTGTAEYVASQILKLEVYLPPLLILMLFYIITVSFANLMGNNVSVILMIPIAIDAARQLALNPVAFALVVTFAASSAYLTPVGYQTNLMVYGPGGYKFRDFMITGAPLQLIMTIIVPFFISILWGL